MGRNQSHTTFDPSLPGRSQGWCGIWRPPSKGVVADFVKLPPDRPGQLCFSHSCRVRATSNGGQQSSGGLSRASSFRLNRVVVHWRRHPLRTAHFFVPFQDRTFRDQRLAGIPSGGGRTWRLRTRIQSKGAPRINSPRSAGTRRTDSGPHTRRRCDSRSARTCFRPPRAAGTPLPACCRGVPRLRRACRPGYGGRA